jgi:hypothetical protein
MPSVADPKPMSRTTAILYAFGLPLALVALIFLPAGRIDWAPGWTFIAVLVAAFGVAALLLARVNPTIYRARSRFQPGTEKWDLILLAVMLPAMAAEIPVATLDAGRMEWSDVPLWVVLIGYVLVIGGIAVTTWAQAVNPFFEPGVRIQKERAARDRLRAVQVRPPSRLYCGDRNVRRNSARARFLVGVAAGCVGDRAAGRANELGGSPAPGRAIRLCRLCAPNTLSAPAWLLVRQ